jgi:hypothetical protein
MTDQSRLKMTEDELIAAVADLGHRVAALEAAPGLKPAAVPPRPPTERGVQIFHPPAQSYPMPSAEQLHKLREIVHGHYPQLRPSFSKRWAQEEETEDFRGFCLAFEFVGSLGRTPGTTDTKHYLVHWIDAASAWCRARSLSVTGITGGSFLTAVIAHGDIEFVLKDDHGKVPTVGLIEFGGVPSDDTAWRRVLASRQVPVPLGSDKPPLYPRPRPEIRTV